MQRRRGKTEGCFKYANEIHHIDTHTRDVCIYNLLRQNRFRRSTRLERFCQHILMRLTSYTPWQMVIILARVIGNYMVIHEKRVRRFLDDFFFFFCNRFIFPGCGTNFCFMCQYYITLWLTYLRPNMDALAYELSVNDCENYKYVIYLYKYGNK